MSREGAPPPTKPQDASRDLGVRSVGRFIAIGGGLGLISSYKIEKKELLDKDINP